MSHNTYEGRCSACGAVLRRGGAACSACGVEVREWIPPANIEALIAAAMDRAEREEQEGYDDDDE